MEEVVVPSGDHVNLHRLTANEQNKMNRAIVFEGHCSLSRNNERDAKDDVPTRILDVEGQ